MLKHILVVAENTVVVAVTENLVGHIDAGCINTLMKQEIGIAQDNLTHKVEHLTALRDADVAPLLQGTEKDLHVVGHAAVGISLASCTAPVKRPLNRLRIHRTITVGDVGHEHIAVLQRQFDGTLLDAAPPVENGGGLIKRLLLFRHHWNGARLNPRNQKTREALCQRLPIRLRAELTNEKAVKIGIGQDDGTHSIFPVFVEQDVVVHIGQFVRFQSAGQTVLIAPVSNFPIHKLQNLIELEIFRQFESVVPL